MVFDGMRRSDSRRSTIIQRRSPEEVAQLAQHAAFETVAEAVAWLILGRIAFYYTFG